MRLEIRQMTGEDVSKIKEMLSLDIKTTGVPELDYIACQNHRIVGVIGYQETQIDFMTKHLVLTRLYVDPDYRHQGIAGKMLVHTLALAKHHDYIEVDLKDAGRYLKRFGISAAQGGRLILNNKMDYDYSRYAHAAVNFDHGRGEQQ